jgi:hypothetical protein
MSSSSAFVECINVDGILSDLTRVDVTYLPSIHKVKDAVQIISLLLPL